MRRTRIRSMAIAGILLVCFWASAILAPIARDPQEARSWGAIAQQLPRVLHFAGVPVSAQGLSTTNLNAYWIPAANCYYSVATGTLTAPTYGAATGVTTLGYTALLAGVPMLQVSTTNAAVISVNSIRCLINPPSIVGGTNRGVSLVDADFFYGIQQAGGVNATQVYVLASGTMNGTEVFGKVAMPAAGAAETPSAAAVVRADAGTLVVNPSGAAFNAGVTTVGSFFTQKYTPATPFRLDTDRTLYYITMTFLCNTTQATTINTPGVMVHYRF